MQGIKPRSLRPSQEIRLRHKKVSWHRNDLWRPALLERADLWPAATFAAQRQVSGGDHHVRGTRPITHGPQPAMRTPHRCAGHSLRRLKYAAFRGGSHSLFLTGCVAPGPHRDEGHRAGCHDRHRHQRGHHQRGRGHDAGGCGKGAEALRPGQRTRLESAGPSAASLGAPRALATHASPCGHCLHSLQSLLSEITPPLDPNWPKSARKILLFQGGFLFPHLEDVKSPGKLC